MSGEAEQRVVAEVRRVTFAGLGVNLGLCALKFVIGIIGASQALVADAVHSLSDSLTDITVYFGAGFWSAPPDEEHPHGHARIETLITSFIGITLGVIGGILVYKAVVALHQQRVSSPGWSAFAAACLSIAVKEWLYRWNVRVGRRLKSSALLANAWHHRSDAFSSLPVALAVLGTRIRPDWGFLDDVATVVVGVLVLYASWQIVIPAFRQLIDSGAAVHERAQILAIARDVPGVREVHALRTRYIGPGLQADLHVLVDPDLSVREGHQIATAVTNILLEQGPDIVDALVHIEPFEDENP